MHFSIHADFVFCGFYFGSYLWEHFFNALTLERLLHYLQFLVTSHPFPNMLLDTAPGPPLSGCDHWDASGMENHIIAVEMMAIVTVCLDSEAESFVCIAHLIPVTALFGQ